MTNQLTDLFDMTDTRDVPDAAIEAVMDAGEFDWSVTGVRQDAKSGCRADRFIIAFARLIAREHPEWVEDPDLATVRKVASGKLNELGAFAEQIAAGEIAAGERDDAIVVHVALAAFKAGRAAERAGQ